MYSHTHAANENAETNMDKDVLNKVKRVLNTTPVLSVRSVLLSYHEKQNPTWQRGTKRAKTCSHPTTPPRGASSLYVPQVREM